MKARLICTGILAAMASFSALAEGSLTAGCLNEMAYEPRLTILADKVSIAQSAARTARSAPERVATAEEREAVALWGHLRQQCFEFGAAQRRASMQAQEIAFLRSVFVFQQRLVADLQAGRLTYAEFSKRRGELTEAAGQEI